MGIRHRTNTKVGLIWTPFRKKGVPQMDTPINSSLLCLHIQSLVLKLVGE